MLNSSQLVYRRFNRFQIFKKFHLNVDVPLNLEINNI